MRRAPLVLLLVLLALAGLAPNAAAGVAWTRSGSYLVGSPVGERVWDACTFPNGATQGVESSCVELPGNVGGLSYSLTDSDRTNTATARACFYDAGGRFIVCGTGGLVPLRAARFAVTSLTGVQVQWTLTVFD